MLRTDLLTRGQGKLHNLMIAVGPVNFSKTFMLEPLQYFSSVFLNLANDKYAWNGVE